MAESRTTLRPLALAVALVVAGLLVWAESCAARRERTAAAEAEARTAPPYVATVSEGRGVSVAVLLDNSGSMDDAAPGEGRPKYQVAREALVRVLTAAGARADTTGRLPVNVGVWTFNGDVDEALPMGPYDAARLRNAMGALPAPMGATAIGDAMDRGREALYGAGTFRKYLLVITDGENTYGRNPEAVLDEIVRRSEGAVIPYYVAFDTDPEAFAFVRRAGGDVLPATDGPALQQALTELYERRILAEAAGGGEPLPPDSTPIPAGSER